MATQEPSTSEATDMKAKEHSNAEVMDMNDDAGEYPSGLKLLTVIIALVLAMFLASLDMTILATAIPRITDQFHSVADVGWYGSAFFLTVASTQSTWGKGYKYFDLKTVFLIAIATFEIASLICAVSKNSATLIVGRAITGVGAAGVIAGCYTIIAFAVPPPKRPAFTGIMGATFGVASVVGPLLGGVLTDRVSWRWCFYINLPIGGVSAAIIIFTFKSPRASRNEKDANAPLLEKLYQMDLIGTSTIMAAVVCLLLALQWGGVAKAWNSVDVIGTLVGFGLIAILFLVIEWWQGERALLLPSVLRRQEVWSGGLFSFFLGGSYYTLMYYIPIYFQAILNVSAQSSGIRNLALIVTVTLFVIISGTGITATGYFAPFIILGAILTTVGAGLLYSLSIHSSAGEWIGFQLITGVGIGLCFQAPIMAAQALSKPEAVSATTAIILFFQTMGGAFFVSAGASGFANALVNKLAQTAPHLDAANVVTVGATELRKVFDAATLPLVVDAYMAGIKVAFAISIALAGMAVLASFTVPWYSVKGKQMSAAA